MDEFTDNEKKLLSPFVSNLDKSIFVLTNLPEVVKGALFSRYSRSAKSLRRVLLDEFMLSEELGMKDMLGLETNDHSANFVQTKKAEEFYDRVLVGYGDDSVAELAGAHIAIEDVSIVATKVLQDARIGLSPLEKSTRYVYFDQKENGKWRYYREKTLMNSEFASLYEEVCDMLFQTYADLVPKVSDYIIKKEPKDANTTDRAYKSAVRAKVCDILRGLLPASTLTNMGFFGDGRAFEYLLTRLYSDDLTEMYEISSLMQQELGKVIPSFVKRANSKHGKEMQEYWRANRFAMEKESSSLGSAHAHHGPNGGHVKLIDFDKNAERKVLIYSMFSYTGKSLEEITKYVDSLSQNDQIKLLSSYIGNRANRRQKPGRAFEQPVYTFEISANYGAYRDMHRHRMLTQERQLLSTNLGYTLPKELADAGLEAEFKAAMEKARAAYEKISQKYPKQAQYVVPLAYNIRWYMTLNLRESYHMLELRSAMQGHIDYRRIAQNMFREIEKVHPALAKDMKFMDMKEYSMERLESEKRIDKKLEEISKKYSQ